MLKQHNTLLELVDKQQAKLQDNCQLQQFLHDVEEINAWISEKKKTAADEGYRVSIDCMLCDVW